MTAIQPPTGRRILLVGCGQLGTELGTALIADGAQIYGLRRDPSSLPPDFVQLAVNLTQPLDQPLPEVDTMVITLTPTMPEVQHEAGYLVALRKLAAALPSIPARVVFVSSTRVFEGHTGPEPVTEADPVAPVSARGDVLVAGEELARDLFNAIIVRPAGIYGPGRQWLINRVAAGAPMQFGRRTNRIHQTDLARGLYQLVTMASPPPVVHAVDQTAGVPLGEVVTYIAELLQVPPPPSQQPGVVDGRIMLGQRFHRLLDTLSYPTFRQGYAQVMATVQP